MSQTESSVAEQMVNMSVRAMETLSRLLATGAKNLAVFLFTMAKDSKKVRGKVGLRAFLDQGRDYKTVDVDKSKVHEFVQHLKDNDLLCHVVSNTKLWEDTIPVMIHAEDAARVNRILERMALADAPQQARQQDQQAPQQQAQSDRQQQNPTTGRTVFNSHRRSRFRPSEQRSSGRESTANTSPTRLRPSTRKKIQRIQQERRAQRAAQSQQQPAQAIPPPQAPAVRFRDEQVMDFVREMLAAITAITQEIARQQTGRDAPPPTQQAQPAPASPLRRGFSIENELTQAGNASQSRTAGESRGQPAQGNPFRGEGAKRRQPVAQRMAAAKTARGSAQPTQQRTIKPRSANRGGR